jgi:hypothetical protein
LYFRGIFWKQLISLLKIIVSFFVLFLSVNGFAGDPYCRLTDAREAGMAGAFISKSNLWSGFTNQAALAFNNSLSFGFNYENRFGISELGTRSAGAVFASGRVSCGAFYSHFGYSDFRRQMIGIACGMPLSDLIAAGVQIDYFSEKATGDYDSHQSLTCEAGIIISASENIRLGIHLFNPVPNSFRRSDMPAQLRAGVALTMNKDFSAGFEAGISTGQNPFIRTGFEYEAARQFFVRGGFSSENNSFCFGFGYTVKPVTIDIGFATHERLGVTSSVSIIFILK